MSDEHYWFFEQKSITGSKEKGPYTEKQLMQLASEGKLTLSTHVRSPTRTKNAVVPAERIPKLAALINQAELDRDKKKTAEKELKRQQKLEAKQREAERKQQMELEKQRMELEHRKAELQAQASAPQVVATPRHNQTVVVNQEPKNAAGMVGFVLSLASLLTCGLLFPVSLIFSFIGLFYKPRAFAVAGFLISFAACGLFFLLGLGILGMLGIGAAAAAVDDQMAIAALEMKIQTEYSVSGEVPNDSRLSEMIDEMQSADSLRAERISDTTIKITHSGFDNKFGTDDDFTRTVDLQYPVTGDDDAELE